MRRAPHKAGWPSRLGHYISGAGSVIDPLPLEAHGKGWVESDMAALRSDLEMVGLDMWGALQDVATTQRRA